MGIGSYVPPLAACLVAGGVVLMVLWRPLHTAIRAWVRSLLIEFILRADWDDGNLQYPQTRQFVPGRKRQPFRRRVLQALCMYTLGHELSSDYLSPRKGKVLYRCRWCDAKLDPDPYFGRWLRARALETDPA